MSDSIENKEVSKEVKIKNEPTVEEYLQRKVINLSEEKDRHFKNFKDLEIKLKKILGVEELGDFEKHVEEFNKKISDKEVEITNKVMTETLLKANDRLIKSEILKLTEYDTDLVKELLKSNKTITVNDEDEVIGLKEAVDELEKRFPQIKKKNTHTIPAQNVGSKNSVDKPITEQTMDEYMSDFNKRKKF